MCQATAALWRGWPSQRTETGSGLHFQYKVGWGFPGPQEAARLGLGHFQTSRFIYSFVLLFYKQLEAFL